jgi:hypothetical protein
MARSLSLKTLRVAICCGRVVVLANVLGMVDRALKRPVDDLAWSILHRDTMTEPEHGSFPRDAERIARLDPAGTMACDRMKACCR